MSYLHDAAVVVWVTLASGAIGAPFAALLPAAGFRLSWAVAPPLGFGLLAVGTGVGYVLGLASWVPMAVLAAVGLVVAVVMGLPALRHGPPWWRQGLVPAGLIFIVAMVCLAPAWTGGDRFRVFQGNVYDHLHYVGTAIAFRMIDYATLTGPPTGGQLADPIGSTALWFVSARGAVSMVLAAVADVVGGSAIDCAYPYMVALQLHMLFASVWVFANVLKLPRGWAVLGAVGLTVGTFEQYVFDINAMSQLAAQPLYLLLFGWVAAAFDADRLGRPAAAVGRLALISGALIASVLYLYPEAWAIYGAAIGVAGLVALGHRGSRRSVPVVAGGLASGAALGLVLCVPLWSGTGAYLFRSLGAARGFAPDWWQYFQRHLLGREANYLELVRAGAGSFGDCLNAWFSLPVEAAMAALGLFLLLPARGWPLPVALAWKLCLYGLLTLLLWNTGRFLRRLWRTEPDQAAIRLLIGSIAACLMPVGLLATGHAWAAGKGLAMAAPLLFALVISPFSGCGRDRRAAAVGGTVVLGHLGLGLLRPFLVMGSVVVPGLPTAAAQVEGQKARLDWDYTRLAGEIRQCSGVVIDAPNPVMGSLLRLIAFESGVPWAGPKTTGSLVSSGQDHFPAGWQQFDCLASADRLTPAPGQRLINLAADRIVSEFLAGRRDTLEIGVDNPPGIIRQGLSGVEITSRGRLQWAAPSVSLELPNRAETPARRLNLALWPMPLSGRAFAVRANGRPLYQGVVPVAPMSFELGAFAGDGVLRLELATDAVTRYPGDPRELGFAIRELSLCR